jgi:N-acetylglutamate synthase-like GNAT family acetyltransferase
MEFAIRPARDEDADAISAVVIRTLRETNAKQYTKEIIERIERSFSPNAVLALLGKRTVFVAVMDRRIVGTAGLDGNIVRTVFVSPDVQARGIGQRLMAEVERTARERKLPLLTVFSSIGAEAFYAQLGFNAVRDNFHGEERTIVMARSLADAEVGATPPPNR